MLTYPSLNAVALQIGPLKIYWYGIMYAISFVLAWRLAKHRLPQSQHAWSNETLSDFILYAAVGVIVGGRLGYVVFYGLNDLLADPWFIVKTWRGGMSFHGGLAGVIISLCFFARKVKLSIIEIFDFAAPLVPLGLALGRLGNFINSEIWGRVTSMPWGLVFPNGGPLPRHPSQLYEALTEGVLLFIIVWFYTATPKPRGTPSALFLCGYGILRFICEFFREPDLHLGFIALNWLTMGQLLSLPMIIIGIFMWWYYSKNLHSKHYYTEDNY